MKTLFFKTSLAIAVFAILASTGCNSQSTQASAASGTTVPPNPRGELTRPLAASLLKQHDELKRVVTLQFRDGPQYREKTLELLRAYGAITYAVVKDNPVSPNFSIVDVSYTQMTLANLGSHQWKHGSEVPVNFIERNSMGMVLMSNGRMKVPTIEIPLTTAEFVEVTGILENGNRAVVEWTWRWTTTRFFEELTSTPGYSGLFDEIQPGVFKRSAVFALYDDGWRLMN